MEVGLTPGSYRIIDLFCFREVLNQIMKVTINSRTPQFSSIVCSVLAKQTTILDSSNKILKSLDPTVFTQYLI